MTDVSRSQLEQQEAMRRINEPLDAVRKQLEPTGALAKALAGRPDLQGHLELNEAMRPLTDPLRVVHERHDLLAASVGRLPPGLHEAMEAHRKMAEGPVAEMHRAMAEGPFAEMQRALAESPLAEMQRALAESPLAEMQRALEESPLAEMQRAMAESPLAEMHRAMAEDPFAELQRAMAESPLAEMHRAMAEDPFAELQQAMAEDPFAELQRAIAEDPFAELQRAIAEDPFVELQRVMAEDPFAELQRAMAEDPFAEMQRAVPAVQDAANAYHGAFRLPPAVEIGRLARELAAYDAFSARTLGAGAPLAAFTTMGAMRNPWLDVEREIRSARALGDLVAIGRGVADLPPFEAGWTGGLRSLLGDWRDPISLTAAWSDRPARLSLYQERGLDPALTHFPPEAFDEAVQLVGLRDGPDESHADFAEDEATARSLWAFERLLRLERALRRFIAGAMEAEFGADWMRRQLPLDMFEDWQAKQAKAIEAGQPECPLIDYADFTHYRAIIERKDNWVRVFKRVFGRHDDVRESFQRLFPLRIATMHARPIEQDDELLLLVESARLLKAIRN